MIIDNSFGKNNLGMIIELQNQLKQTKFRRLKTRKWWHYYKTTDSQ